MGEADAGAMNNETVATLFSLCWKSLVIRVLSRVVVGNGLLLEDPVVVSWVVVSRIDGLRHDDRGRRDRLHFDCRYGQHDGQPRGLREDGEQPRSREIAIRGHHGGHGWGGRRRAVARAQQRHATRDRGHGETDAERHNEIRVEREHL